MCFIVVLVVVCVSRKNKISFIITVNQMAQLKKAFSYSYMFVITVILYVLIMDPVFVDYASAAKLLLVSLLMTQVHP